VPERLAIAEPTYRFAIFDDVRDYRYLGWYLAAPAFILGPDAVLLLDQRGGCEFELAELAGEGEMLFVAHRLSAKP
jgi:hypothetical protein